MGERMQRGGPFGDVGSRVNGKRVPESDGLVRVSQILDPRLALTQRQRAVGNCYGAYAEAIVAGGPSVFLRERVDASGGHGGGMTDRMVDMIRMVKLARRAAEALEPVCYPLRGAIDAKQVGLHSPIAAVALLDAVCLSGVTLDRLGHAKGWTVEREDAARRRRMVVPDRQRKRLAEALRVTLDAVDAAWEEHRCAVPWAFMTLEVK